MTIDVEFNDDVLKGVSDVAIVHVLGRTPITLTASADGLLITRTDGAPLVVKRTGNDKIELFHLNI